MTLQVTLIGDLLSTSSVALVLAFYTYISIRYRVHPPSRALLFGVAGIAVKGKMPKSMFHHEASLALLALAGLVHFMFGHELAYEVLEPAFGVSYLLVVIVVLREFRKIERESSRPV